MESKNNTVERCDKKCEACKHDLPERYFNDGKDICYYCEQAVLNWMPVKDLPKYDDHYVLFVRWSQLDSNESSIPVIIESFAGNWAEVKTFRRVELEYIYTHWKSLSNPPNN